MTQLPFRKVSARMSKNDSEGMNVSQHVVNKDHSSAQSDDRI
jgi:hypothetical protein